MENQRQKSVTSAVDLGDKNSCCHREGGKIVCGGPSAAIIVPILRIMLGVSKSSCNSIYTLLIISLQNIHPHSPVRLWPDLEYEVPYPRPAQDHDRGDRQEEFCTRIKRGYVR
jgi:hypothetical protein